MSRSRARRSELEQERVFALRSLEDLEKEHAAGDVDESDYAVLRSRYVERAAAALRAVEAAAALDGAGTDGSGDVATSEPSHPGGWLRLRRSLGRRRSRRLLGVGAAISVVIALGLVAAALAGVRLPGEDATGTVDIPLATQVNEQLAEASSAANDNQLALAVETYDAVLAEVPNQPEALTYKGWLVRLSGLQDRDGAVVREGDALLAKAAKVAPRYPDGRVLDGIALLQDRSDPVASIEEFRGFLADEPPASLLNELGAEVAAAFIGAGQPVPPALRSYERPTTTT